jgi:hypothetical protein
MAHNAVKENTALLFNHDNPTGKDLLMTITAVRTVYHVFINFLCNQVCITASITAQNLHIPFFVLLTLL